MKVIPADNTPLYKQLHDAQIALQGVEQELKRREAVIARMETRPNTKDTPEPTDYPAFADALDPLRLLSVADPAAYRNLLGLTKYALKRCWERLPIEYRREKIRQFDERFPPAKRHAGERLV